MKWLILTDYVQHTGGLQSRFRELALAAIELDHKVDFACYNHNPYCSIPKQYPNHCRVIDLPDRHTRSIRPKALTQALALMLKSRPDVLLFGNAGIPNFFPHLFIAPLLGVRHRVVHYGTMLSKPKNGLASWGREMLWSTRLSYRNVTLSLFNNSAQRDDWVNSLGVLKNNTIWDCPINLDRFKPCNRAREQYRSDLGLRKNDFVVGGVGTLNRQKSFDRLLEAVAMSRHRAPDIKMVVAGEGDQTNLLRMADRLDIRERVQFLGRREDIPGIMNAFDVFCMPSTHANETLGIVFAEALATGVPIIVPDLPGPRRVAQDGKCGIVADTRNPSSIADALVLLHNDRSYHHELYQKGLVHAKSFGRTNVFHELVTEIRCNT